MEEGLLKNTREEPMGKLLYQSHWKEEDSTQPVPVFIYEHAITYRDRSFPFDFDLRFKIKDSVIHFHVHEREQQFNLVDGDEEQWKDILKGHLNQIGFH